jgi:tRNA A-37 threonylcarbamoyl transferase component Bud32
MGATSDRGAGLLANLQLPERYQLVRRIANGGMASVWCAEDRVLGRRVAIKLLADRYAYDEMAVQRFKREARVAARLSGHQNIVTIFDVGEAQWLVDETSSRAFIVMEYLAGGTVGDALRVGAVTREEAVRWIAQTASALDYAHARDVVHRDIKPANLLLDCDRFVHVADFGIARVATDESLTRTDMVLGTAAYIAPEQAMGRPATAASDRYALAVAAYELLVGERPFGTSDVSAQARQHVEETPPSATARNRDLPRGVDAVLARGMAKRPEDRWPSAGAFAEALETALRPRAARTRAMAVTVPQRPVAAAAVGARPAAEADPVAAAVANRSPRRSLALGALAAVVLGVLLVGIATALSGGSSKPRTTAQVRQSTPTRTSNSSASRPAAKTAPKRPAAAAPKTTTTPSEVTGTAAAATTPTAGADALEADGHALMNSGNYQAAIPILQQAVNSAPKGSLTYAYALYDLGRSLRLAGNPQAAVSVLYQRLQIPNQTGAVQAELQRALLQMGKKAGGGASGPAPGHGPDGHGPPGPDGHGPPGHAG